MFRNIVRAGQALKNLLQVTKNNKCFLKFQIIALLQPLQLRYIHAQLSQQCDLTTKRRMSKPTVLW